MDGSNRSRADCRPRTPVAAARRKSPAEPCLARAKPAAVPIAWSRQASMPVAHGRSRRPSSLPAGNARAGRSPAWHDRPGDPKHGHGDGSATPMNGRTAWRGVPRSDGRRAVTRSFSTDRGNRVHGLLRVNLAWRHRSMDRRHCAAVGHERGFGSYGEMHSFWLRLLLAGVAAHQRIQPYSPHCAIPGSSNLSASYATTLNSRDAIAGVPLARETFAGPPVFAADRTPHRRGGCQAA